MPLQNEFISLSINDVACSFAIIASLFCLHCLRAYFFIFCIDIKVRVLLLYDIKHSAMEQSVLNQITSELLCYVQNKMTTNDHEFVIKTVIEFYTEEKIYAAKNLFFFNLSRNSTTLKSISCRRSQTGLPRYYQQNERSWYLLPIICSAKHSKATDWTADAFNLAKLSKDIASVLNIEQNVATSSATLADLQHDLTFVLEKCSKIDVNTDKLEKLKSTVDRRNARRVIESDSSASDSISTNSTAENAMEDTTEGTKDSGGHHKGHHGRHHR